jgi:NAD(P)-dependent dehydrogenase (short-subunit alcohol dehydrogenase family)
VDEAHFDEQFNINVKGAYFTIQQLLPIINEGGSILLNGSINAHIGMGTASVYSASKAAALSFIRTLSPELLSKNIRINAVSPGPVRTPLHVKLGSLSDINATESPMIDMVPLKRFGTPEEIARIAVFFASDDSTFIIGGELIADGGMGL